MLAHVEGWRRRHLDSVRLGKGHVNSGTESSLHFGGSLGVVLLEQLGVSRIPLPGMHGWGTRMLLKHYLDLGVRQGGVVEAVRGESADDPLLDGVRSVGPGF